MLYPRLFALNFSPPGVLKDFNMYSVMIRIGDSRKIKRETFESSAEAEAYFDKLCERRTDYPATVVTDSLDPLLLACIPYPDVALFVARGESSAVGSSPPGPIQYLAL